MEVLEGSYTALEGYGYAYRLSKHQLVQVLDE